MAHLPTRDGFAPTKELDGKALYETITYPEQDLDRLHWLETKMIEVEELCELRVKGANELYTVLKDAQTLLLLELNPIPPHILEKSWTRGA